MPRKRVFCRLLFKAPKKTKGSVATIIICILLAIGGISFGITMAIMGLSNSNSSGDSNNGGNNISSDSVDFGSYRIEKYEGDPYYIYQKDYTGDYDIQFVNLLSLHGFSDDDALDIYLIKIKIKIE